MFSPATIRFGSVHANHGAFFCLRLLGEGGERLTRADIAGVSYSVAAVAGRTETPVTGHTDVSLAVADCVLTEFRSWTVDAGGYNVRVAIPHTTTDPFPVRGQYRVSIEITTTGGRHVLTVFLVTAR